VGDRIGNSDPIKSDVHVLAATHRDLQKSMREGAFRSDLFYRLNVFPIALPRPKTRIAARLSVEFLLQQSLHVQADSLVSGAVLNAAVRNSVKARTFGDGRGPPGITACTSTGSSL
jgi:transcriptional regulator with GAF, ATPase, and Fis domain